MLKHVAYAFERSCSDLTSREREIFAEVLRLRGAPGADDNNYVYRLYWLARVINAKKIVELGATPGTSTLALAFARRRSGGMHWSCDIGPIPTSELSDYGVSFDVSWVRFEHTSAADLGRAWTNGPVDFIYLDTSHGYDATVEEINAWFPHLREGGLFVFHDVEACRGSVFRALSEAILQRGCSFEYHHFPDCYGHGVLQWFKNERFHPGAPDTDDGVVGLSMLLMGGAQ